MARKRTVNYAVVDIKLLREGVTPETYVSLFKELQKNYREIPLTRNNYLKLRSIKPLNENNLINGFKGEVFKSNGITNDWYDEEKDERNRNQNVGESYIPANLKANPRFFKFVFYPLHQKLVCEIKYPDNEVTVSILEDFLKNLLITEKLQSKFGRIVVSVVPEIITAQKIIQSKKLKRIHLSFEKPFSEDLTELEKQILVDMNDQNIEVYMQTFVAGKNDFLALSDKAKELVKLATNYGVVEYKIENEEELIEDKSTAESNPLIVRIQYDPEVVDQNDLILSKGLEIVNSIENE
ncbi:MULTISPECIES: DUF4747 family protein [Acinetobacter calcoaceticus/baumannii complex]|jgi:hypothetical protein|nr:DUF4747 family protein [Acinetobacter baumannii]EKW4940767.1 DUF4747 family protein [Acinetobacter baumannii]ELS4600203.1 DUF4747 family protein [Acinetobacter baumannii]MDV7573948.1 DUF4747 family protein [Acinetobacter baumannii]HEM7759481.1 DUF4747 family protein [Acinetobacter baumannii]